MWPEWSVLLFLLGYQLSHWLSAYDFKKRAHARQYYDMACRLSTLMDDHRHCLSIDEDMLLDNAKVALAWGIPDWAKLEAEAHEEERHG